MNLDRDLIHYLLALDELHRLPPALVAQFASARALLEGLGQWMELTAPSLVSASFEKKQQHWFD